MSYNSYGKLLGAMCLWCVLASAVPALGQSVVTWTGTAGTQSYADAGNWDPAGVPLDGGGSTYRAVIPGGNTVQFDVSGTGNAVTALQVDAAGLLTINPDRELTVLDEAAIGGMISAPGGVLTAASLASRFTSNSVQLSATGGGRITIAANAYDARGITDTANLLYAHGDGSLIDLSSVQTLDARVNVWPVNTSTIAALNDARIDLSGLQTVYGRTGDDILRFQTRAGGQIDLSSLQSLPQGHTVFDVEGAFSLPALTSAAGVKFVMADAMPLHLGSLTNVQSVSFDIPAGATLDAPNLVTFNHSGLTVYADRTYTLGTFTNFDNSRINVQAGATFQVAATTYSCRGIAGSNTILSASGTGAVLDAGSITDFDGGGNTYPVIVQTISATNNGVVDLSGVQTLRGRDGDDRLDLVVNSGGDIDLSALQTITGGRTRFDIDRSLPYALASLETAIGTTFDVSNVATVQMNALTSLDASALNIEPGGTVNAPLLTSFTSSQLHLTPGRNLNAPLFTNIDNSRISVEAGATFQVDAATYSATGLAGTYTLLAADGAGSRLDLSSITSIDDAADAYPALVHTISATNDAVVDLSGLQTVRGRTGDDRLEFYIATGGQIDLSSLKSTTLGSTRFAVNAPSFALAELVSGVGVTFDMLADGSALNVPKLADQDGGAHNVPANGTFTFGVLTALNGVTVTIGDGGVYNAPNLASFTHSSLDLAAGRTFNTPAFGDIDNSRISVSAGATLQVSATAYSATGLRGTYTLFSADGTGSRLDLSSITSIDDAADAYPALVHTISATNDAVVDLSGVQTVTGRTGDDRLVFAAAGGGLVDLSGLRAITGGNTRFQVHGGGRMLLGNVTQTTGMAIDVAGSTSELVVSGNLDLAANATFAATGGAAVRVGGNFSFATTVEAAFNGDAALVHLDGDGAQWMEVGGADLGVDGATSGNFGLAQLTVGTDTKSVIAFVVDLIDNGNRASPEALYLYGNGELDGLELLSGSTLYIGNINVYAMTGGEMVHLNGLFAAGERTAALDDGFLGNQIMGDATLDDKVGLADLMALADNYGLKTGGTWIKGDFNFDGEVGLADLAALADNYGAGADTSVPEPTVAIFLIAGVATLWRRRR